MLRLKDIPPAEMPEVLRIAGELQSREQAALAQDEARQHLVDAAGEVGLPEKYLEQAAEELHRRKVHQIEARRTRRRNLGLAAGGVLALTAMGWLVFSPRPSPRPLPAVSPIVETFDAGADSRWMLEKNPSTDATLSFTPNAGSGTAATLTVRRFGNSSGRTPFFVNLDTVNTPRSLTGYQTVSFRVRSEGLSRVRFDLQNGPNERWRSPALPVTGAWQQQRVRLDQFERQVRSSSAGAWRSAPFRHPDAVQRFSFKVGYYVNDQNAKGQLALDDLQVE